MAAIELKRQDNTFGIVTPKRAYYVKASTLQESQDWIRALNEVKTQLSQRNTMTQEFSELQMSGAGPSTPAPSSPPPLNRSASSSQGKRHSVSQAAASRAAVAAAAATTPSGPPISISVPEKGSSPTSTPAQPRAIPSRTDTLNAAGAGADRDAAGAEQYGLSYASSATQSLGSSPGRDGHAAQHSGGELSDSGRGGSPRRGGKSGAGSKSRDLSVGSSGGEGAGMPSSYQSSGVILSSSEEEDEVDDNEELDQAMPLPTLPALASTSPQPPSQMGSTNDQGANAASTIAAQAALSPSAGASSGDQLLKDPNRVIIQGYLMKQSNRRKQWRKRWFVLTASKLMYTRSHMDAKAHRQIPLTSILDAIEHTSEKPTMASSPGVTSPSSTTGSGFNFNALGGDGRGESAGQSSTTNDTPPAPPKPERRQSVVAAAAGVASNLGAGVGLERDASRKRMDNCFKIITPKRIFLLCAPSEEEEIKWLSALQALLTRTRGSTSSTGNTPTAASPGAFRASLAAAAPPLPRLPKASPKPTSGSPQTQPANPATSYPVPSILEEASPSPQTEHAFALFKHYAMGTPAGIAVTTAVATSATIFTYWRFFRRIKSADFISPRELKFRRTLVGKVTSIGDADGFRLYHQPGPPLLRDLLFPVPKAPKDLKDQTISVRLAGADAPEMAHFGKPQQPFAQEAKDELKRLVEGRTARCEIAHVDQYRRIVATPYVWHPPYILGRTNVSLALVKAGLATVYRQSGADYGSATFFSRLLTNAKNGLGKMERAEARAQRRKIGIWSLGNKMESPAEYKKKHKAEA